MAALPSAQGWRRWLALLVLGVGPAAACELLMTAPAPAPPQLGLAFAIGDAPPGGRAAAFSRVRRVKLRFARPDGSTRDTSVAVVPVDGVAAVSLALQVAERVPALGVLAELGTDTAPLFRGGGVVQIEPGVPTVAEIPLMSIPAQIVAVPDELTLRGPGATFELSSVVLFATGDTIHGAQGLWSSEDPTTVSVTPAGLATAERLGETELEVRLGTVADTVPVVVAPLNLPPPPTPPRSLPPSGTP